jgi:hypothetical protein
VTTSLSRLYSSSKFSRFLHAVGPIGNLSWESLVAKYAVFIICRQPVFILVSLCLGCLLWDFLSRIRWQAPHMTSLCAHSCKTFPFQNPPPYLLVSLFLVMMILSFCLADQCCRFPLFKQLVQTRCNIFMEGHAGGWALTGGSCKAKRFAGILSCPSSALYVVETFLQQEAPCGVNIQHWGHV